MNIIIKDCHIDLINRAMRERGMSRTKLADILGKDKAHITRTLNGKYFLSPEFAQEIAIVLDLDAERLLQTQCQLQLLRFPISEERKAELMEAK